MKAIIIGGTGATGREVVKQLLEDDRFNAVTALVRRPFFEEYPKLKQVVVDFENLANYKDEISGDIAFSCLGTTLKDAGSKDAQWRVDHDYQLEFARLAKENGVERFVLMSSFGANANSRVFYSRMKGVLEKNVRSLDFKHLFILHPGGIERPNSTRKGEKAMISLLKVFNVIGLFKGYEPMSTSKLAKALIASPFEFKGKQKIVGMKEIKAITKSKKIHR